MKMVTRSRFSGRFFQYLLDVNRPGLDDFKQWLFHPGMLFQAPQQWWGRGQNRPTAHEGIDICWFEDTGGNRRSLGRETRIPAPFPGRVAKISRDFLGLSIFLAHDLITDGGRQLYTAFGHTAPVEGLGAGEPVAAGEAIAWISVPADKKSAVPPHLHLTLAFLPDDMPAEYLTWDRLGIEPTITLLDPLVVFPTSWSRLV